MRMNAGIRRLDLERRALIRTMAGIPVAGFLAARPGRAGAWTALEATPACADDEPTPSETAGPYFKPDSPERGSLFDSGMEGTRLVVSGLVLSTGCKPVPRALLDFWQADTDGGYDLRGFRLRGHQFADASGRFRLETIVPGLYGGRARHIHVRVQVPEGRVLTTVLYFPREAANEHDNLFSPRLVMDVRDGGAPRQAAFNFVLRG